MATGVTRHLRGTGSGLSERDRNLRLDLVKAQLELTTTNSDLNTQYKFHHGEYLGVRLADLSFTGPEDVAATVTIPTSPPWSSSASSAGMPGRRAIRTSTVAC